MQSKLDRRTRSLAFGIGAACLLLELLLLLGLSHATAPEGRVFAGAARSLPVVSTESRPVILLRRLEISL